MIRSVLIVMFSGSLLTSVVFGKTEELPVEFRGAAAGEKCLATTLKLEESWKREELIIKIPVKNCQTNLPFQCRDSLPKMTRCL